MICQHFGKRQNGFITSDLYLEFHMNLACLNDVTEMFSIAFV